MSLNTTVPANITENNYSVPSFPSDAGLNTSVPAVVGDNYTVPSLPIESLSGKEDKSNKGIANGYAPLDATSKVPSGNLPTIDVSGQITTHNSLTTSVHGIANTANLVTTSTLATHSADTTAIHGITNTAELIQSTVIGPNVNKVATFTASGGGANSEIGAWGFGVANGGIDAYIEPEGVTVEGAGRSVSVHPDKISFDGSETAILRVGGIIDTASLINLAGTSSNMTFGSVGGVSALNTTFRAYNYPNDIVYLGHSDLGGGISPVIKYLISGNGADGNYSSGIASTFTGWVIAGEEDVLAYEESGQGRHDLPIGDFWTLPNGAGTLATSIDEGNSVSGGIVNTSGGGGSIDTRGAGAIELGWGGTRTTIFGTALANRTFYLPDASGTGALTNDSRFTNARTPTAHTHGFLTNDGRIGTTSNLPVITMNTGVITTGTFGTTANSFCQGQDSRLSDARTPTAHTHAMSDVTSLQATLIAFAIALG